MKVRGRQKAFQSLATFLKKKRENTSFAPTESLAQLFGHCLWSLCRPESLWASALYSKNAPAGPPEPWDALMVYIPHCVGGPKAGRLSASLL